MSTLAFLMGWAVVVRLGYGDFKNRGGSRLPLSICVVHGLITGVIGGFAGAGLAGAFQ